MKTKTLFQTIFCLTIAVILAVSCKSNTGTSYSLEGTWVNPNYTSEVYSIYGKTFDAAGSYAMQIKLITYSSIDSGIIYGVYTTNSYYTGVEGKYYAVSFKGLNETDCSFSGAYKGGGKSATDNLAEAIAEFTEENGYFSGYSTCKRQ